MNLFLILLWFPFYYSNLVSCSLVNKDKDLLIKKFTCKLEEYFYSALSDYIMERNHLLPLLDFHEFLERELEKNDHLTLKDILELTLRLFKVKYSEKGILGTETLDYINASLEKFCLNFESDASLIESKENNDRFVELNHLIFKFNIDFEAFYSENSPQASNGKLVIDYEKKWQLLRDALDHFKTESHGFLNECKRLECFDLFADLPFFLSSLTDSLMKFENQIEYLVYDVVFLFISQVFDVYKTVRGHELLKMSSEAQKLCQNYFAMTEDVWMDFIDTVDSLNSLHENDWNRMSKRILDCAGTLRSSPSNISSSADKIINNIHLFCLKNQNNNIKFNPKVLSNFIILSFEHFFEVHYNENSKNEVLISNLINFQRSLNSIFDGIPEFELYKTQLLEIEGILNSLLRVSDKIPEAWRGAQIFSEFDEIGQFFKKEVISFCDDIKSLAVSRSSRHNSGEEFILELIQMINYRCSLIKLPTVYVEIFQGFIEEFYRNEFFSKVILNSNSGLTMNTETENRSDVRNEQSLVLVVSKELIQNPSQIILQVKALPTDLPSKQDLKNSVIKIYSAYISAEFKDLKDSNLNEIISNAILNNI